MSWWNEVAPYFDGSSLRKFLSSGALSRTFVVNVGFALSHCLRPRLVVVLVGALGERVWFGNGWERRHRPAPVCRKTAPFWGRGIVIGNRVRVDVRVDVTVCVIVHVPGGTGYAGGAVGRRRSSACLRFRPRVSEGSSGSSRRRWVCRASSCWCGLRRALPFLGLLCFSVGLGVVGRLLAHSAGRRAPNAPRNRGVSYPPMKPPKSARHHWLVWDLTSACWASAVWRSASIS